MSEQKKIYCGNGKKNEKYDIINFSICLDDIPGEYITGSKNGKRYVKLTMSGNYQGKTDKFGNTHNVTVNTWKPEPKQAPDEYRANNTIPDSGFSAPPAPEGDPDLPF